MDLCQDVKTTQLELINDIADNICKTAEEKGDLTCVEFFFKKLHPERCMNHVVEHVLPYRKKIKKRDERFFEENKATIFEGLSSDRIEYYSSLLNDRSRVTQEDIDIIWQYFDTILELGEKYKKHK